MSEKRTDDSCKWGELHGLAGVKKPMPAYHAKSVTHAMDMLKRRRGVTASGADGALNVWRDDKGRLRVSFCRYQRTIEEKAVESMADVRRWLKVWWPKLRHGELADWARAMLAR